MSTEQNMYAEQIYREVQAALTELLAKAKLRQGDLIVVGCSSSEICGGHIGQASSAEVGAAVYRAACDFLQPQGIYLACQCCEHLNRALIIERAAAREFGYTQVNAMPSLNAGGAFATAAYKNMQDPVAVEYIQAAAGLDIGDTFIGMHLRPVAVPLRLVQKSIGQAHLSAARTRARYIGGPRTQYDENVY